ncbi:hypothetical protein, partial [Staphylococcus haemolyticus]|uniref:hypothetical protein n=1 Tax=Staphylococcus haemolyticus TaxID=1283 RepID=UPI001C92EF5C
GRKIGSIKKMNFEDKRRGKVGRRLYEGFKKNGFEVLNMLRGDGKRGIGVKMVGVIGEELESDVNMFLMGKTIHFNY